MRARLLVSLLTLAWAVSSFAAEKIPPEKKAAMDELWRRGHCMLSSVVVPAQRASKVPAKLQGAKVLDGRAVTRIGGFSCFACDEAVMWLATDARLDKVDLNTRKRIATFTPCGLSLVPDWTAWTRPKMPSAMRGFRHSRLPKYCSAQHASGSLLMRAHLSWSARVDSGTPILPFPQLANSPPNSRKAFGGCAGNLPPAA